MSSYKSINSINKCVSVMFGAASYGTLLYTCGKKAKALYIYTTSNARQKALYKHIHTYTLYRRPAIKANIYLYVYSASTLSWPIHPLFAI